MAHCQSNLFEELTRLHVEVGFQDVLLPRGFLLSNILFFLISVTFFALPGFRFTRRLLAQAIKVIRK